MKNSPDPVENLPRPAVRNGNERSRSLSRTKPAREAQLLRGAPDPSISALLDEAAATRAFCNGDAAGLEWLARRYMPHASLVARALLRSRADAEDVVQDAFVRVWSERQRFTVGRPFGPWLFRIVRNRALDLLRHRHAIREESIDIREAAPRQDRPDVVASARILADTAYEALRRLPPMQRTVACLALLGGFGHAEIARMMSLREATVRSHLALARKRLRAELLSSNMSSRA